MGLMDIVKKLLTGATDEENARNKARMRELFNECVPEGDQYTLIYCHMEDFTDAVVVKVTTHSNFIVGYKPGEVVVVPVDAELKGHEEPVVFNKENGGQIKSTLVGTAPHPSRMLRSSLNRLLMNRESNAVASMPYLSRSPMRRYLLSGNFSSRGCNFRTERTRTVG